MHYLYPKRYHLYLKLAVLAKLRNGAGIRALSDVYGISTNSIDDWIKLYEQPKKSAPMER